MPLPELTEEESCFVCLERAENALSNLIAQAKPKIGWYEESIRDDIRKLLDARAEKPKSQESVVTVVLKTLSDNIEELTKRVQSLEEDNRRFNYGGNSDDD